MTTSAGARLEHHDVDISPLEFWARPAEDREPAFARLRAEAPVSWQPPIQGSLVPPEHDGVWAVATHELITAVSRDPDTFCSGEGFQMEAVPEDINVAAGSFLAMDAPRHGPLRKLVSAAFTPRQVRRIEDQIRGQAAAVVDDVLAAGDGDFVADVSRRMPRWTIYEMIGLDGDDERAQAAAHADAMVSWADPEVAAGREPAELLSEGLVGLLGTGIALAEARRTDPREDLMTALVHAEVDGQRLTTEEIASFFVLLSVAGNDTTRNTISLTMRALQQFPDQCAHLTADFDGRIGPALEEFVRWATPVMTFRRTATRDVELGGQQIRAGDWVALLYSSGNRDETVFDEPDRFDVARARNPHLGFGAGGPHFCLGTFVAKMQLRSVIGELLHRVPTLELGEPTYLAGNFVRAVRTMPYTVR